METKIYQDTPVENREAMLEANAQDKEEMLIKKHFEEDETNDMRRRHVANSIAIKKKMEEFNIFKAEIDAIIKPLTKENEYLLNNVRAGYVEVNQQVYIFPDYDNFMMIYYDNNGEMVHSRRMVPHERQRKIS